MVDLTTAVLTRIVLGTEPKENQALGDAFKNVLHRVIMRLNVPKSLWGVFLKDQKEFYAEIAYIKSAVSKVIEECRKAIDSSEAGKSATSLLSIMFEQAKGDIFTEAEILDEATMFYVAGFETSSNALGNTLHLLAQYPEVARKVREEVDAVCGKDDVSFDHLNDLDYTEMVIKESMRLFPPASFIGRTLYEDLEFCGHKFKKGTNITTSIFSIHRDPEYWPNPDAFNPDRFREPVRPGTFTPFGVGKKTCIGNKFAMLEMKTAIAHLARQYDFSLDPAKPMKLISTLTLGFDPAVGIHLFVKNRK